MMRLSMWVLLVGIVLFGVACSSSDVMITSAAVSRDDMRLRLSLSSCNADLVVDLEESADEVVVTVSDAGASFLDYVGGSDCDDHHVLSLGEALGARRLIDGSPGTVVDVSGPIPDGELSLPYDPDKVTEAEYLAALEAMVACLEAADPELEAWIYQDLDWKTYRWHKDPDEQGNLDVGGVIEQCHLEHIAPLE